MRKRRGQTSLFSLLYTLSYGMSDSIFVLACDDGFQLRARAWGDSLTNPKGLVVLVHGMAEYGARYEEFAAALVQANYRVWCADHRGHGLNITDANPNGHVADHDTVGRAALDTLTVVRPHFKHPFLFF